jgi:hypothetical protein
VRVYGLDGPQHDGGRLSFRPIGERAFVEGAWDRALETVRLLASKRRVWRLAVSVNQTVVDGEGAEHYRRLREELRPLGVRNQLVVAYRESATYGLERDRAVALAGDAPAATIGQLGDGELRELLDAVESDLDSQPLAERVAKRYYLDGLRRRLLAAPSTSRRRRASDGLRRRLLADGRTDDPRCVALGAHLRLYPNGDVPTCQFNSRIVGNLRERSFAELWRSAAASEQRDWVRRCPGCWAECEVLPNALYSGALLPHAARSEARRFARRAGARIARIARLAGRSRVPRPAARAFHDPGTTR